MLAALPSQALGLSLVALNLFAAVFPPAAHAAAHRHEAEHHSVEEHAHHGEPDAGYSHDADGHLHIDLQATATSARPDLTAMASREIALPETISLSTRPAALIDVDDVRVPSTTHDPPTAPRAPPSR